MVKKSKVRLDQPMEIKERPMATIEKANGGFIIKCGQYGEMPYVAKDMKEAQKIQAKLLKKEN
jgi:hypothetical protein